MKKTLLSLMLLAGMASYAQLPDGTPAPDFTVTDINGNPHTLSEYLAAGKTVILDISATWCAPCWAYKQSHKLADLYKSYGLGGSEEVVILFVEGDPTTTMADLYGTGTNTQGDWTADAPYAIIDSAEIADLYDITYFPTLYRICPAGTVTEYSSSLSLTSLRNNLNTYCGTMTGVQNHAQITSGDLRTCDANATYSAKVKNYGKNAITTATAVVKENGTIIGSMPYAGSMNQYGTATINFPSIAYNPNSDYTVSLDNINQMAPFNPSFSTNAFDVILAGATTESNVEITVHTDNYPGEISWILKDEADVVVATGGPYQGMPNGAAGGPDANTSITASFSLALDKCYTLSLADAYGDGWGLGTTPHGITVTADDVTLLDQAVGNFGSALNIPAAFRTATTLGTIEEGMKGFRVYPNPSTGIFTFESPETVSVTVADITGKVVFTSESVNNGDSINLTSLMRGVYIAKMTGATTEKVEKLIIK